MDENTEKLSLQHKESKVPESPKPLAFTIDLEEGRTVDIQRHKSLVERYQNRHRRVQSLSKLDSPAPSIAKSRPLTANLPRKSSTQSEGYFSSDEKNGRVSANFSKLRNELTLPLKNVTTDKMTHPNCNFNLPSITTPEVELKDVSSPELDLTSPFSPLDRNTSKQLPCRSPSVNRSKLTKQNSTPECESKNFCNGQDNKFIDGVHFDFDKSDAVSDSGTYTVDAENYSEEQKARMSIDDEFKIEQVSLMKKTEDYIKSLVSDENHVQTRTAKVKKQLVASPNFLHSPVYPAQKHSAQPTKLLSPILSPTQNFCITQNAGEPEIRTDRKQNNFENGTQNKTFNKIMFPSPKAKSGNGLGQASDQGSFTSVTSSGVFSQKTETCRNAVRRTSLTKSEVHVEMYTDNKCVNRMTLSLKKQNRTNLTANLVHVEQSVPNSAKNIEVYTNVGTVTNLPPAVGGVSGKSSPSKIPSPIHTGSRTRSRNGINSLNVDLSDSSLETESYLKPTQHYINSLQQRLSLDSDHDSDYGNKYNLPLNNDARNLLKQKPTHARHNSFDDKNAKISNKLEHFQSKNLQGIDQTYMNKLNQYSAVQKVQNSPNSSPIRRSSSFSAKNQYGAQAKPSNLTPKDTNSPNFARNGSIKRSASTASIRPAMLRRASASSEHQKIDRNQFYDTESSSEDDFDKTVLKKKGAVASTRYNRAFSLRRARLDEAVLPKCPNTPEMRRKFQPPDHLRGERAFSVDRKPAKMNDVQSRYLTNMSKVKNVAPVKIDTQKYVPKPSSAPSRPKPQVLSRTDTGRFSMRVFKPHANAQKNTRKDPSEKKPSGGRSNSSLSSREVEFQNWKRRKSYDPMKAAAEGKRKAELKKQNQNVMTQSYTESQNQDCDSSPSHSGSVHRSQSFHGTAALEQLVSSEEEDEITLSADEGFSPPTPSPCELSPARASLRLAWRDRILY